MALRGMRVRPALRPLFLAFALTNTILYACILPLWEGFDEPFHYGYVQAISVGGRFPILNQARISAEIRQSFHFVPLSRFLSEAMPGSLSFEQWPKLSDTDRQRRRAELNQISPQAREKQSDLLNYEAQQAPLAYLMLAPFDLLLRNVPIRWRILCLRLLAAITATLAIFFVLEKLSELLGARPAFSAAALACVFQVQMLWASIGRVGNDFLAVPLIAWFLTWLLFAAQKSTTRNIMVLAGILATGLLTKAYFLAFVPVAALMMARLLIRRKISARSAVASAGLILLIAGPWYARNLFLYQSLSGTQQSITGIGPMRAIRAVPLINWPASVISFAHWSLWTGNWSFLSFSRATLDFELSLLLVAATLYLTSGRSLRSPQAWLVLAYACFATSLVYQTAVTWIHTNGLSNFPEPWYAQGLIACGFVACFVGLQSAGLAGKIIASALTALSAWIAAMTYYAKLLPYYGSALSRSNVAALWRWWRAIPVRQLDSVLMVPPMAVFIGLSLFTILLVIATGAAIRGIWRVSP